MRFVAVKTPDQRTLLALYCARQAPVTGAYGHDQPDPRLLLEFGVSLPSIRLLALPDDPTKALLPRLV